MLRFKLLVIYVLISWISFVSPEKKGRCPTKEPLLNDENIVVPDNGNVPAVSGKLKFQQDSQKLYIRLNKKWNAIAKKLNSAIAKLTQVNAAVAKLTSRLDKLNQTVEIKARSSCASLYRTGARINGVYTIDPDGQGSFQVRCDMSTNGGGWTVFQRRQDGSQNFYLGWSDYKAGFGDFNGEFWLGLDKIHRLSKSGQNVLRVDLMDFDGAEIYAKYGMFSVADESDKYRLNIDSYSGDAGDSLAGHNQMQFSTKDSDNDATSVNCAKRCKGGWWYKACQFSNLNGPYLGAGQTNDIGITWYYWKSSWYSYKKTEIKIRPSQF
ncbi:ryncolin-1-like [Dendronephthya gigantea]|uniref:ryncolin-1-like n=1 Tax=Dendronephthya gigantea TaxID=151771 RepID=UPI00106CD40A|nr:ryncolin-1-like [Dendronephthya gigantea]